MRIASALLRSLVSCILLPASTVSFAQSKPGDVVVDIPFNFVVARQHLPAGHYIVTMQNDSTARIFQPKGRTIFVPTGAGRRTTDEGSKLVFHRYGDTYFLSTVCVTGKRTTRELYPSAVERELAQGKAEMELAVVDSTK